MKNLQKHNQNTNFFNKPIIIGKLNSDMLKPRPHNTRLWGNIDLEKPMKCRLVHSSTSAKKMLLNALILDALEENLDALKNRSSLFKKTENIYNKSSNFFNSSAEISRDDEEVTIKSIILKNKFIIEEQLIEEQQVKCEFLKEIKNIKKECSEKGWDGYGAIPIQDEDCNYAKDFLWNLFGKLDLSILKEADIIPSKNGRFSFEWFNDKGNSAYLSINKKDKSIICSSFLKNKLQENIILEIEGSQYKLLELLYKIYE